MAQFINLCVILFIESVFGNANVAWASGQENSVDNGEECVALTGAGTATRVNCAHAHPYICRKEAAAKCGTLGNGYEYEPRTGSCYKFHRIALPWRSALATCFHEAHLAVVNSAMESSVLREIFAKNPAEVITGTTDPKYALVGFRKYEDGEWATINGEPLVEAGFLQWSTGEPNNAGGNCGYCGSIFRDGLYNDLYCTYAFAYICEITP